MKKRLSIITAICLTFYSLQTPPLHAGKPTHSFQRKNDHELNDKRMTHIASGMIMWGAILFTGILVGTFYAKSDPDPKAKSGADSSSNSGGGGGIL